MGCSRTAVRRQRAHKPTLHRVQPDTPRGDNRPDCGPRHMSCLSELLSSILRTWFSIYCLPWGMAAPSGMPSRR